MQDKTYEEAVYDAIVEVEERRARALEGLARTDLLLVLLKVIKKKAGEVA